jgi:hypothetical protein
MLAIVIAGTTVLQLKTYRDILQRTYKKGSNGAEGESQEPVKTIKNKNLGIALLIFLWIYSIFWSSVFILKLIEYLQHQALVLSFKDWTGCIFKNFLDAKQPDAWRAVCGNTPKFKLSFSFVCWGVLWTSCHSLLVVAIYIPEIWLGGLCRSAGQRVGFEVSRSDKSDAVSQDVHMGTAVHVRDMEGGMDRHSYPNYDENEKNKSGGTWPQLCDPATSSPEHKL